MFVPQYLLDQIIPVDGVPTDASSKFDTYNMAQQEVDWDIATGEITDGSNGTTTAVLGIGESLESSWDKGIAALLNGQDINFANLIRVELMGQAISKITDSFSWENLSSVFTAANGGIASGGFRAFANGGTVTKPTLGLVGEGRYNEAVVPLPDGKSIPVIGAGGSTENNITINVTVDSDGSASSTTQSGGSEDQGKQLGYMVSQAVQAELVDQQRPGGLLSRY